ncbi:hypothetical protein PS880_05063 [Pseudomonas fluorescens]|uniref:Uncharacterized protein n=1 Tax=Pseudomonas fluorescens TaxID=294 RepID=A0A5E7P793_PSEFL|nr:hypothetical protein PS880_05063 [Pseudomonas fluorescens]
MEAAARLFSKLGSLGRSIRKWFSRIIQASHYWEDLLSHAFFSKMLVCEQGDYANDLTYFKFRILRRPQLRHSPLEGHCV